VRSLALTGSGASVHTSIQIVCPTPALQLAAARNRADLAQSRWGIKTRRLFCFSNPQAYGKAGSHGLTGCGILSEEAHRNLQPRPRFYGSLGLLYRFFVA
jgi:hypothetical protein